MDASKLSTQEHKEQPVRVLAHFICLPNEVLTWDLQKGKLEQAKDAVQATFQHHAANPGPAIPKEFNVPQEGTKEERRAKAAEMNK